jgi:hypothetical protein
MKLSDWLTITAIIVGPIAAWLLSYAINKRKEAKDRKLNIFRTLMATRSFFLRFRLEHVGVLNTIPVEFSNEEKVLKAWRDYLFTMNSTENNEELWRKRNDAFFELVHRISKSIGYNLDKDQIMNTSYEPSGYGDEAQDWIKVRKSLIDILDHKAALPVEIKEPTKAAAATPQH